MFVAKGGGIMIHTLELSRLTGFFVSMMFSISVIFFCSFGIISIFRVLSKYDLNDLSNMANNNVGADEIVASLTGISIDEDSIESKLYNSVNDIIYGFEDKDSYTFKDSNDDANKVLSDIFGSDYDSNTVTGFFDDVVSTLGDFMSF